MQAHAVHRERAFTGREERGLHLDGDGTHGFGVAGARGDRHRDVEQRHDDPAMRGVEAVHELGAQLQAQARAAFAALEQLDAEVARERNVPAQRLRDVH